MIAKTADDTSVNAGDPIGFTVKITNTGAGDAYDTKVSDTLPAGFVWTIDSEDPAELDLDAGTLTFGPATLAAGDSATVHIVADTDATLCKKVPNTASVEWTNEGTGDYTATTEVLCPDIKVTKDGNGPIGVGDTATFTIKVENLGPGIARDVTLTDQLPAGANWASPAGCTISPTGLLECELGDDQPRRCVCPHDHRLRRDDGRGMRGSPQPGSADGVQRAVRQARQQHRRRHHRRGLPRSRDHQDRGQPTVSAGDPIGFTIEVTSMGPDEASQWS